MPHYAAFLRGMNLGRRRITNEELCGHVEALGFSEVGAFLASGNVIFESTMESAREVERLVEAGLQTALGYPVRTFLRTASEVRSIAEYEPFGPEELARSQGKPQIGLLSAEPTSEGRTAALALITEADRLALHDRELYWLPQSGVSDSDLDFKLLEAALGPMTVRTRRTLERMSAKYFGE